MDQTFMPGKYSYADLLRLFSEGVTLRCHLCKGILQISPDGQITCSQCKVSIAEVINAEPHNQDFLLEMEKKAGNLPPQATVEDLYKKNQVRRSNESNER